MTLTTAMLQCCRASCRPAGLQAAAWQCSQCPAGRPLLHSLYTLLLACRLPPDPTASGIHGAASTGPFRTSCCCPCCSRRATAGSGSSSRPSANCGRLRLPVEEAGPGGGLRAWTHQGAQIDVLRITPPTFKHWPSSSCAPRQRLGDHRCEHAATSHGDDCGLGVAICELLNTIKPTLSSSPASRPRRRTSSSVQAPLRVVSCTVLPSGDATSPRKFSLPSARRQVGSIN